MSNYTLRVISRFLLCGKKKKKEIWGLSQHRCTKDSENSHWGMQHEQHNQSLVWQASFHLKFFGNWISRINFPVSHRIGFQLIWVAEPHNVGPHSSPGLSGCKAEAAHCFMPLFSSAELPCYLCTSQWHYKANLITTRWAFWDSWRKGATAVTMLFVMIRSGTWVSAEGCRSWIQASAVAIGHNDPDDESGWMGNNLVTCKRAALKIQTRI